MGYCYYSDSQFNANGWRIGYIENNSAHLISAGAPECMCTDVDGSALSDGCIFDKTGENSSAHVNNLQAIALKYCNETFVNSGVCSPSKVWAMNTNDFFKITGITSEFGVTSNNVLIDNGGYYWIYHHDNYFHAWLKTMASNKETVEYAHGVRPVIQLAETVYITGGSGTYTDPYQIAN